MRSFVILILLALAGCAVPVHSPRSHAADLIKIDPQSEWADFADYLRGVIATVEARWFAILDESRVAPRTGTHVVATFSINADGAVTILKTDGDAGLQGIYACTSALAANPVGKRWTDAMVAKLGRQQTLTFTFFYQ